jgi:ubiquinone/menaquinone biosynthesis C-methylase UbiE
MHHTHAKEGEARRNIHSHSWLVGAGGLLVGLFLLIYIPTLPAISGSLILFGAFHIVGGSIALLSAYSLGVRKFVRGFGGKTMVRQKAGEYDFGWGPEWMNGLALAALAAFSGAVAIIISAETFWPLAFVLVLLSAVFLAGNFIMRSFRSRDHIGLPMVRLLTGNEDHILDAGCGAGRTTVALSRVLGNGHVTAVDRFDADYIDEGGRAHIDHNLKVAGIADRVTIEKADLTSLPFDSASFDAAVSTNVFDHLGDAKLKALEEVERVLKPGGRFLMAVWVPGWPMFAVANVLSFFLMRKSAWRDLARQAGFAVVDEGSFNYAWFVLLEKPASG